MNKENNDVSSDSVGVPQLIEAAKLFVITVIIAAALQKIGEGLYAFFHFHGKAGGASNWEIFQRGLLNYRLWQILIVVYFIATMIRHAGAIFAATPLFRKWEKEDAIDENISVFWKYSIGIFDLGLTLLLFLGHYIIALSLSDQWAMPLNLGNIEPAFLIIIVLVLDFILCGMWVVTLTYLKSEKLGIPKDKQSNMLRLNKGWAVFSAIEALLFLIILIGMEASDFLSVNLTLSVTILVAALDFHFNGKHWRTLIEGRI